MVYNKNSTILTFSASQMLCLIVQCSLKTPYLHGTYHVNPCADAGDCYLQIFSVWDWGYDRTISMFRELWSFLHLAQRVFFIVLLSVLESFEALVLVKYVIFSHFEGELLCVLLPPEWHQWSSASIRCFSRLWGFLAKAKLADRSKDAEGYWDHFQNTNLGCYVKAMQDRGRWYLGHS